MPFLFLSRNPSRYVQSQVGKPQPPFPADRREAHYCLLFRDIKEWKIDAIKHDSSHNTICVLLAVLLFPHKCFIHSFIHTKRIKCNHRWTLKEQDGGKVTDRLPSLTLWPSAVWVVCVSHRRGDTETVLGKDDVIACKKPRGHASSVASG